MKINRLITIESALWNEFQRIFPREASTFCNEQMRLRVASAKGSSGAINIELLRMKQTEVKKELDKYNEEFITINDKISMFDDNSKKAEVERLKQEKIEIEALTKCDGCGFPMHEAHITTQSGFKFCRDCFFNENPKMMKDQK